MWVYNIEKLGYKYSHINLSEDSELKKTGYYNYNPNSLYMPKALHKPQIIGEALDKLPIGELLVYLDIDAIPIRKFDEVDILDYDIGVTKRINGDDTHIGCVPMVGMINAGVIFFRNTPSVRKFVQNWQDVCNRLGGDQYALNELLLPEGKQYWHPTCNNRMHFHLNDFPDKIVSQEQDLIIKIFPSELYNCYRLDFLTDKTKIVHLKGHHKLLDNNILKTYVEIS